MSPTGPCAARSAASSLRTSRVLRAAVLTAAASALACATSRTGPERLPPSLAVLTVNEGHPRMSPARFDHAAHARRAAAAGEDACAGCHHPLRDDPRGLPQPCTACHVPSHLAQQVDESKPHRHDAPPDL